MAKKKQTASEVDETEVDDAPEAKPVSRGRSLVRMCCSDGRKEVGVSEPDGPTTTYHADFEGVIEAKSEHVELLEPLGWTVIE